MSETLVCIDPTHTTHAHCPNHGCVEYVCCMPAGVSLVKPARVLPIGSVVEYCGNMPYMFPNGCRGVVVQNASAGNSFYAYDVVFPNDPHSNAIPAPLAMSATEIQLYR